MSQAVATSGAVILHVSHGWGGGTERWVRDFACADSSGRSLVLRSFTGRDSAAVSLELFDPLSDSVLLDWPLEVPIGTTAVEHAQYRSVLQDVISAFGVQAVIVSSLIGHSLEALDSGLPTALVLHDFYPFCPGLFAWFDEACTSCDRSRLKRCLASNPQNVFWHHDDEMQWLRLRRAYLDRLSCEDVKLAAPSRSVHARWSVLLPELAQRPWALIPHGLAGERPEPLSRQADARQVRLRIVLPGRLQPHKGLHLFRQIVNELLEFADVLLLGCGDFGKPFLGCPGIEVVQDYGADELEGYVRGFRPDCALLLSVLPETFSYTLSEMHALGFPVVATRIGAFEERIEDGQDGFLVSPDASAVLDCLRRLNASRGELDRVAERLAQIERKDARKMVRMYRSLLSLPLEYPAGGSPAGAHLLKALVRREGIAKQGHEEGRSLKARLEEEQRRAMRLEGENAMLEGRLQLLEVEKSTLLASSSWRVTAPLRAVRRMLSRSGAEAENARSAIDHTFREESQKRPARLVVCSGSSFWARRGERTVRTLAAIAPIELQVDAAQEAAGFPLYLETAGPGCPFSRVALWSGRVSKQSLAVPPDLVLVTGEAERERWLAAYPSSQAQLRMVPLPAVLGTELRMKRDQIRTEFFDFFGLPSRTRIVASPAPQGGGIDGLAAFARLAMDVCATRNDLRFFCPWTPGEESPERAQAVAQRQLFIVDPQAVDRLVAAADCWVSPHDEERGTDEFAVEAWGAGVSVVLIGTVVPKQLDEALGLGEVVSTSTLEEAASYLRGWEVVPQQGVSVMRREKANEAAWESFLQAWMPRP